MYIRVFNRNCGAGVPPLTGGNLQGPVAGMHIRTAHTSVADMYIEDSAVREAQLSGGTWRLVRTAMYGGHSYVKPGLCDTRVDSFT